MEDKVLDDEAAARELARELQALGVPCRVHWDRSPWGAAIPLTAGRVEDIPTYDGPTLYVMTENEFIHDQRRWFAVIDGLSESVDEVLQSFVLEILEYDTIKRLASDFAVYVELLKHGAIRTHATLA